jgi:sugar O-acyltransferase (sialic acid O-acetyltransferase NeuD family)
MQNLHPIIIYGAGGHGHVIAESLILQNIRNIIFWDQKLTENRLGFPSFQPFTGPSGRIVLGVGNIGTREQLLSSLSIDYPALDFPLIHPNAFVSPSAHLEEATWVGPMALVHAYAKIGSHCIINSGAKVDHEVILGHNVHIAPGATLCGSVNVGNHTFIGANAVVPPGISIGNHVFVRAGSIVKENIPDGGRI